MKILIIGATGFIGRKLAEELASAGHEVTGLSRNPRVEGQQLQGGGLLSHWDGKSLATLKDHLKDKSGVVNLAGENIGSAIWTKSRKKKLSESRTGTGRLLSDAILMLENKPAFLVQASASGFYGYRTNEWADENSPKGDGFLAELTMLWESSVADLHPVGVRTVFIRTGIVLGKNGGIMKKLLLPFRFYAGTILGSGNQWVSWIHIDDLVRAIHFLIQNPQSSGPYNLVSPMPVTMAVLVKEIAKATGKPIWMKIPGWLLKTLLGEMATETVLASQRITPLKLQKEGFQFKYPSIDQAIDSLLANSR